MGQQFVAPAFITVVVGGATNVIAGALGSQPAPVPRARRRWAFCLGAFLGTVALLLAALIIIRLMPDGISAWLQRRLDQRARMRLTDGAGWRLLNGPEDIGRGPLFWLGFAGR